RLECAIVRLVLITLLEEARPVGQARFLQRPAHTQIAHLAPGEVRDPFEGRDRNHAMSSLCDVYNASPTVSVSTIGSEALLENGRSPRVSSRRWAVEGYGSSGISGSTRCARSDNDSCHPR